MKKKFVANLAFLLGLNLLIKPFWIFGIDRSVQNAVGASEYGMYYVLFNFSFLFNILLDAGITNFNNRNIAQNQQLVTKHLSGIILLRLLLAVVYIGISLFFARVLDYPAKAYGMLLLLLFNQVLISFILYLRSSLAGLHLFKTDSFISILDKLVMIIVCSFLLWSPSFSGMFRIEWFIWAQTASYLLSACMAFFFLTAKSQLKKLSWSPVFFIMILKQSYPFAILILLMTFSYRIDSVMLERMLPDGSMKAGIYAQAYRLLDAAAMIAYLFAGLLLPMFARMLKLKEKVEELTRLSFSLIIVPAILAAGGCYFFKQPLMELLYDAHTTESAQVLGILMICFIALSSSYIFGTLLTAGGNLKYLNYTALGSMILNIALNLVLIPVYEIKGAAMACLCTQFASTICQVLIARKVFGFSINVVYLIKLGGFALSACFLFSVSVWSGLPWIVSLAGATVLGFVLAFAWRIFRWNDLAMLSFKNM